jgi:hypothetical protein
LLPQRTPIISINPIYFEPPAASIARAQGAFARSATAADPEAACSAASFSKVPRRAPAASRPRPDQRYQEGLVFRTLLFFLHEKEKKKEERKESKNNKKNKRARPAGGCSRAPSVRSDRHLMASSCWKERKRKKPSSLPLPADFSGRRARGGEGQQQKERELA